MCDQSCRILHMYSIFLCVMSVSLVGVKCCSNLLFSTYQYLILLYFVESELFKATDVVGLYVLPVNSFSYIYKHFGPLALGESPFSLTLYCKAFFYCLGFFFFFFINTVRLICIWNIHPEFYHLYVLRLSYS